MKFNNWNLNHEIQLKFKLWNSMSLNFKVKQFNMTFNANLNYEIQSRCTNTEDTTQQHDHVHRHKNAHRQWHCTSTQKYISTQNVFFTTNLKHTMCLMCLAIRLVQNLALQIHSDADEASCLLSSCFDLAASAAAHLLWDLHIQI